MLLLHSIFADAYSTPNLVCLKSQYMQDPAEANTIRRDHDHHIHDIFYFLTARW